MLPAHASEPIAFDGQAVCARMKDLATALSEWLASEQTFVERVTSRLPPTPPNFARIVELNEAGSFRRAIRRTSKPGPTDAPCPEGPG